ncbi:hypothetical protein CJJ09_000094 [Candidozyma auris]|nr:hypothetical protein CJJ09_000094 [[Candida] auris]
MVRNYYQRNAAKNGWQQLVLDADGRLEVGLTHAQLSNVDATIVVKPQRRPDENPLGRRQEEHVNGSFGSATVAALLPCSTEDARNSCGHLPASISSSAFPPKRASVGSLLSGPVPVMYEQTPYASTIPPATAPAPVTLPPVLPASQAQQPAKRGGVKPSIMSLLNADSTGSSPPPMSAPTASPASPQQPQISTQPQVSTQPVQPAPAPAPSKETQWISFEEYKEKAQSGRIKVRHYEELVSKLNELRGIQTELMPHDVIATLKEFTRSTSDEKVAAQRFVKTLDEFGRANTVGKRKDAVANISMVRGEGLILVVAQESKYNIFITCHGGGVSGQAEASMYGIAKALVVFNPMLKPRLRKAGLMTRDSRVVERKKPGKVKARKSPTWVKR